MANLQKIKMYYDPLGRVVRTVNPDQSEQRVVYGIPTELDAVTESKYLKSHSVGVENVPTPWENYTYDTNDLADITPGGATVPSSQHYTPKSAVVDALGRTVKTTEHIDKTNTPPVDNVVMQYRYDIRGNLLNVLDPYQRKVFEHVYDLRPPQKDEQGKQQPLPPLKTTHLDKGESTILFDASGKPIESFDAKGATILSSYDILSRQENSWARNETGDTITLKGYIVYGETAGSPEASNLNGKPHEVYDEAGKIEYSLYDFKGNILTKTRHVVDDSVLQGALSTYDNYIMDWDSPPTLSSMVFSTDMVYDALNRITELTLPEDLESERKKIIPTYNSAGALEKVDLYSPTGPTTTNYVENIAYNAKGQRLLIAFGNGVMTRYAYDPLSFRLQRQRSEKYTKSISGSTITYAYNTGLRQDDGFNYDLAGNILKILDRMNDCGIGGTPHSLDRVFTYDALYRLTSATGRESNSQNANSYIYSEAGVPTNFADVRAYSRTYSYDKLGNIQSLVQIGTNGFTRNFNYNTGVNTLQEVRDSGSSLIEDFTYDANGNQLTAGSSRYYVWNHSDQLLCYYNDTGGGPTVFAQYDYAGQDRVSKIVRTGSNYERTIYIDGIFEYVKLENGSTYEKNYIHIMDDKSRIAEVRINPGSAFPADIANDEVYILENQIGTAVMRLGNAGTEIDREEYYPFGDSSLRTFTYKRYRYVGKEKDAESGLYYYGARYYAAWTCRFISVDPLVRDYPFYTPYNYAGNKPINKIDIDGMQEANKNGGEAVQPAPGGDKETKPRPGADKNTRREERTADYFNNMKAVSTESGFDGVNDWVSKTGENGETVVETNPRPDGIRNTYYGFETPKTSGDNVEVTGSTKPSPETNVENQTFVDTPAPSKVKKSTSSSTTTTSTTSSASRLSSSLRGGSTSTTSANTTSTTTSTATTSATTPPDPNTLCFICFIGDHDIHWIQGVKDMAKWLVDNPAYRIVIFATGGATDGKNWADPSSSGESYLIRLVSRFNTFKSAVEKAGDGKIPKNSLLLQQLTPAGTHLDYMPLRR